MTRQVISALSDVTSNLNPTHIEEIPGLKGLWTETLGDPQICIAVLDGPVDHSHPSLAAANLAQLETLASGTANQGPASQHGTHIASVIFGQYDGPIKGIAPRCRGLSVPIFSDGPDGSIAPCSQLDLARAIIQAVEAGAHIINISGGELSPSGSAHPLLADAVQKCASRDVLIVAATGNEGCDCLQIPGALPSVLAVGAMNAQGLPLEFGNWGTMYRTQGILAPGENIVGAKPGGNAVAQSGTSYATPIVSGVAGLILSLQLKLGRQPDPQAVRAAMLESAYACDPQAFSDCRPFLVGGLNIAGTHRLILNGYKETAVEPPGVDSQVLASKSKSLQTKNREQPRLKEGDAAPDFSIQDHTSRRIRLSDYRGKAVVLWFYPQADTPG
jgi:cyanobactin maturation PatA/PatG family protease